MEIDYVILGLLNSQPSSGYDLKKIIAESDLFYWSGNNNQIYKSLIQLHKAGLVTQETEYQESLPAKKIYSITSQGKQQLRQWALSDPKLPEVHHHFLIQLAWTGLLETAEVDGLLAEYEEEVSVQLRMQEARVNRPVAAQYQSARENFLWEKIHRHMLASTRRELDWVQQVRSEVREIRFPDNQGTIEEKP